MKKTLISLLCALAAISAAATTVPSTSKIRLCEGWEFLRSDLGSPWEAVRPAKKGSSESVPIWSKVTLPHCFNAEDAVDPDVNYYQGPGWYRKKISFSNPYPGGRTILEFEGAGQKTRVYVGTDLVASHVGGYDGWCVDITEALGGKNEEWILVRCDNSRDTEMIPSDLSDFNVYGGIYRYLNLVYTPAVRFGRIAIESEPRTKGRKWDVRVRASLLGESAKELESSIENISVTIKDPDGNALASLTPQGSEVRFGEGEAEFELGFEIARPRLWSDTPPEMYTCEIASGEFRAEERFGLRTFEFQEKGPFFLNGKRLLLRGTHRHEDHAGTGSAMTEEMMRREMIMMKDMGVNFIRLGHYQQSEIILNLCDSLGILVWEEIPWCRGGLGGKTYRDQARRMLRNMISQHYNHPSVIIWGLGNENDWPGDFPEFDKAAIHSFMSELNDIAHECDPSRKTAIRRCEFCNDIVDVYSPSIWAGWYRGVFTDYKAISEREMSKVPRFLHVEWGGDSHAGRHSENVFANLKGIVSGEGDERAGDASLYGGQKRASKDGDWSESYIVRLIDWHLKEQETMPWLSGTAYWPFKDFSTPVRPENPVPYVNQKGVVERDLTPKESYYVFQSYWTEKPMAHIYGHSWPIRWGDRGDLKEVLVYSNCDEAELFVNGISQGVRKRNSQDFPAAGLRWNCEYNKGENQLKVVARKGKTVVVDEITQAYETRKWGKEARIEVSASDCSDGIAQIDVRLVDEQGVPCLDSRKYFRFSLVGTGSLIVNQGTASGSKLVQACNGSGRIRLRTKTNSERNASARNIVCISVEGLEPAFVEL